MAPLTTFCSDATGVANQIENLIEQIEQNLMVHGRGTPFKRIKLALSKYVLTKWLTKLGRLG